MKIKKSNKKIISVSSIWRSDWPSTRKVEIETSPIVVPSHSFETNEIIWEMLFMFVTRNLILLEIIKLKSYSKFSRYPIYSHQIDFLVALQPFLMIDLRIRIYSFQVVHMTLAETIYVYISAFLIVLIIGLNVVVGISAETGSQINSCFFK